MIKNSIRIRFEKMIRYCDELIEKCKGKAIQDLYDDYDEFYEKYDIINWREITVAKNKIFHDYESV